MADRGKQVLGNGRRSRLFEKDFGRSKEESECISHPKFNVYTPLNIPHERTLKECANMDFNEVGIRNPYPI